MNDNIIAKLKEIRTWNEQNNHSELNYYIDQWIEFAISTETHFKLHAQYSPYLQRIYASLGSDIQVANLTPAISEKLQMNEEMTLLVGHALCVVCDRPTYSWCACTLGAYYCSCKCQEDDWDNHKKYCILARKEGLFKQRLNEFNKTYTLKCWVKYETHFNSHRSPRRIKIILE